MSNALHVAACSLLTAGYAPHLCKSKPYCKTSVHSVSHSVVPAVAGASKNAVYLVMSGDQNFVYGTSS